MDEAVLDETDVPSVGERLRSAREEKGLNLEDIAAQTRIPRRHLESLETSDWDKLPAATYTIGFAKSYASAIGLDRADIGEQLRAEMGGHRVAYTTTESFEPADPARTMPKALVIGAIVAVIVLVVLMTWLSKRSLEPSETNTAAVAEAPAVTPPPTTTPTPAAQPLAQGPVVITAVAPAWLRVTDGSTRLFEGMLQPGQTFQVPQTATAPMLRVGAPEAVRINVGTAVAPPVGPAGQVTSNVSLLAADLMRRGGQAGAAASTAQPTPAPATK
jgi:cytoskeletal protein RodZ